MAVFAPGEAPPGRRLYLIAQGVAVWRKKVLVPGASWGEPDVMLHLPPQPNIAKALTYLRTMWLGRDEIRIIEESFPAAYRHLKIVTLFRHAGDQLIKLAQQEILAMEADPTYPGLLKASGYYDLVEASTLKALPHDVPAALLRARRASTVSAIPVVDEEKKDEEKKDEKKKAVVWDAMAKGPLVV